MSLSKLIISGVLLHYQKANILRFYQLDYKQASYYDLLLQANDLSVIEVV